MKNTTNEIYKKEINEIVEAFDKNIITLSEALRGIKTLLLKFQGLF